MCVQGIRWIVVVAVVEIGEDDSPCARYECVAHGCRRYTDSEWIEWGVSKWTMLPPSRCGANERMRSAQKSNGSMDEGETKEKEKSDPSRERTRGQLDQWHILIRTGYLVCLLYLLSMSNSAFHTVYLKPMVKWLSLFHSLSLTHSLKWIIGCCLVPVLANCCHLH